MDKQEQVQEILDFIRRHRESYASLAVCRRALDQGLGEVNGITLSDLEHKLDTAPEDEIAAYYSIIK